MRIKWFPIKYLVLVLFFSQIISFYGTERKVQAFSNQVIQHGAVGEDVIELQSRLQYIGFYNGKIDGVFDWRTYWALRNFQYEFGLPIDGLAGQKTKAKLVKATKYHKQYVQKQIGKGNKFTHYGGMDLNKQSAPAKQKAPAQSKTQAPAKPKTQAQTNPKTQTPAKSKTQAQTNPKKPTPAKPKTQAQTNPKTQAPAKSKTQTNPKTQAPAKPKMQTNPRTQSPATPRTQAIAPAPAKPKTQAQTPQKKPTATNTPNGFSQNDIKLLANAVYGESRGEPYIGQVAVAAVILNRINSSNFPNTVSGVIFEPGAFTAVADGQIWLTPNENAKKAVLDALNGWDPTGEAIYYFNPDTATNGWIWSRPQIKKIGKHIFCK
ncbi:cell wall hydrolase [Neobacillus sp. LXY-4]|uniref:cell wall hydrolase n=1 Tax=Neobacillus sp. LXY-4 TaxID=3379826 RepID=UPI003EE01C07